MGSERNVSAEVVAMRTGARGEDSARYDAIAQPAIRYWSCHKKKSAMRYRVLQVIASVSCPWSDQTLRLDGHNSASAETYQSLSDKLRHCWRQTVEAWPPGLQTFEY